MSDDIRPQGDMMGKCLVHLGPIWQAGNETLQYLHDAPGIWFEKAFNFKDVTNHFIKPDHYYLITSNYFEAVNKGMVFANCENLYYNVR